MAAANPTIEGLQAAAYKIPTDAPESDGTYAWNATTLVVVHATAGGKVGVGYTYADAATATLIRELLAGVVKGRDAFGIPGAWAAMVHSIRNLGRAGIASMAISAVDAALWDLKGKLLDLPVVTLLGAAREGAPIYGSGGFTSYDNKRLKEQLGGWVAAGIPRVKMKIGTHPEDDPGRVRAAREAIGDRAELFVDSNGAYSRKQALAMAEKFADEAGVTWFEEPVSADDLDGLRLIRDRAPAGMEIAAGEYGYDLFYFRRMLDADSVDVLQADASRCGGHHRVPEGRQPGRGACDGNFRPLRPHAPCSRRMCGAQLPPSGVFPRPRTDRAHAFRRRPRAGRGHAQARPLAARPGDRIQATRRRSLCHLRG